MNDKFIIYGIFDLNTNELGYIGQTNSLERRKRRHLNPTRRAMRRIDYWMRKRNYEIKFVELFECERKDANNKEAEFKKNLNPSILD